MNAMQGCQEEEAIKEFLSDRVSNSHDPRTEEEKSGIQERPKIPQSLMTETQKKADAGFAMYTEKVAAGISRAQDAAVKWTPVQEPPNGKFYDTSGHWYEDDPEATSTDPVEDLSRSRKDSPVCTGLLDYFPLAMMEIAKVSKISGQKHHPGEKMHWERGKSTDHEDCLVRHLLERGGRDGDGQRHTAKVAWRALALLQLEIENDKDPV